MIDTVLFDLAGTLLPMVQEEFVKAYMSLLANKMANYGYDPKKLVKSLWAGTEAMVRNDGHATNEAVFWETFCQLMGPDVKKDLPLFEEFYAVDFGGARTACGFAPEAAEVIEMLKERGATIVLATNPLFPAVATRQRVRWAGLDPEDFAFITTYENSNHCKPNPDYYRDLLNTVGKAPEQCVMVGNDVGEDMVAGKLGMKTFLLTDCLINKGETDIGAFPNGSFGELKAFLEETI